MRKLLVCFAAAAMAVTTSAWAAQDYIALEQRLSAEQMQATGLDTLSPEQLALLNRLLSEERAVTQAAAPAASATAGAGLREKRTAPTAFTASVPGEVRNWSQGNVVTLDNGQRWRITEGTLYLGKPVSNPRVTIAPGFLGSWYLQMDGQVPRLKVQRVQ
jgi:hypothetical protein